MPKKKASQENYSDKYFILSENLNRLEETMQLFSSHPDSGEVKQSIQDLLIQMHNEAKCIGGIVFDHTNDLEIDIQLFLKNPQKNMTPVIFQDFQTLKNDLRSL